nr:hypothetical protein [Mycolicibacterium malmesburyense]CRL68258.1 hypothetical protein CPGR_00804 [Mycolicibacterium malmesburyense]
MAIEPDDQPGDAVPTGAQLAKLGVTVERFALAVEIFGSSADAWRWVETIPPRSIELKTLKAIKVSGIEPDEFARWRAAGLSASWVPSRAVLYRNAGVSPEDLRRWREARLDEDTLPPLLPYLTAEFDFEALLNLLIDWKGSYTGPSNARGTELKRLLDAGLGIPDVIRLIAAGSTGHELYEWVRHGIPTNDWPAWIANGIGAATAKKFFLKGVAPDVASEWLASGLDDRTLFGFIDLDASPAEAQTFTDAGVSPDYLVRTEDGLVEVEPELEPWEVDPAEQLPAVIQPGRISLVLWSMAGGGDYQAYDVSFDWNGRRYAEWYQDISMAGGGLSPASSSPIRGTADWTNGRDVSITYEWSEMGYEGSDELPGLAPTSTNPDTDEGARDPRSWIRLGHALIEWVYRTF